MSANEIKKILNKIDNPSSKKLNETFTPQQALQMIDQDKTTEAFSPDTAQGQVSRKQDKKAGTSQELAKQLFDEFERAWASASDPGREVEIWNQNRSNVGNEVVAQCKFRFDGSGSILSIRVIGGSPIEIPRSQFREVEDMVTNAYKRAGWATVFWGMDTLHLQAKVR
mgnify:CR=1 FL=1